MHKIEVELFPDSGHHFYFVPIAFDDGTNQDQRSAFETAYGIQLTIKGRDARTVIDRARKVDQNWTPASGENLEWLRFKFGHLDYARRLDHDFFGARVYGLWLAIETATGLRERGYVWEIDDAADPTSQDYKDYVKALDNDLAPPTPYIARDTTELLSPEWSELVLDIASCCGISDLVPENELLISFYWIPPNEGQPIPVSLIVDFGNSRTVVLGLENASKLANSSSLSRVCHPIDFSAELRDAKSRSFRFTDTARLIPESWFILREPSFHLPQFSPETTATNCYRHEIRRHVEERRAGPLGLRRKRVTTDEEVLIGAERRIPQMFVKLSPAAIGQEAKSAFARVDISRMGKAHLSSPKRYVWDIDPVGADGETFWQMIPNDSDGQHTLGTKKLAGDVLLFMEPEGSVLYRSPDPETTLPPAERDNTEERPVCAPEQPDFSHADSLILVALSIIEIAWEQINSQAWREGDNYQLKRFLQDIVVTYPPGWTRDERVRYFNAWTAARNIFFWSRVPHHEDIVDEAPPAPRVVMNVDEAIAAQLPIIFSDVLHLKDSGRLWADLFGRERGSGQNSRLCVRVLSLDFGGGTTDTAVVEYTNIAQPGATGAHLNPSTLFSDSSTIAGDSLIEEIISDVVLPKLAAPFVNDHAKLAKFRHAINVAEDQKVQRLRNALIIRTVFLPLIIQWLEDFKFGDRRGNPETQRPWTPREVAGTMVADIYENVEEFNRLFRKNGIVDGDVLSFDQPFSVDYDKLDALIRVWCTKQADTCARYIGALDCDLVIVSGKVSELPQLREILEDHLPIELERIVFAHRFYAGDWFPGAQDGRIQDAKMVTATGAALYHAMANNFIKNWDFSPSQGQEIMPARNYWGRHSGQTTSAPFDHTSLLLDVSADECIVKLSHGQMIGRARFLQIPPEPVYQFRWRPGRFDPLPRTSTVSATLRRVRESDQGVALAIEHLELVDVEGEYELGGSSYQITLEDVELRLQTLPGEGEHWLDSGSFDTSRISQEAT